MGFAPRRNASFELPTCKFLAFSHGVEAAQFHVNIVVGAQRKYETSLGRRMAEARRRPFQMCDGTGHTAVPGFEQRYIAVYVEHTLERILTHFALTDRGRSAALHWVLPSFESTTMIMFASGRKLPMRSDTPPRSH